MPRIAVTMPTRNRVDLIGRAIRSLGRQTFRDFELLVGDDGCTDGTPEAVEREAKAAGVAFRIIGGEGGRIGQTAMRNRLIRESDSEFIAAFDDDDEALPHRLEIGIRMMERDPRMAVTGGMALFRDETAGCEQVRRTPTADMDIRRFALARNPFLHPTVMMARSHLPSQEPYDKTMERAQDALLWAQMTKREDIRFANTGKVTVIRHLHGQQTGEAAVEDGNRELRKRLAELNAEFLEAHGAPKDVAVAEWLATRRWWRVEPDSIPDPERVRAVYGLLDRRGCGIAGNALALAIERRSPWHGRLDLRGPVSLKRRILALRALRVASTIQRRGKRMATAVRERTAPTIRRRRPSPEEERAA